jgi:hypothetical protein
MYDHIMNIPVIRLNKVFHVGSLDRSRLGENSGASSQEGACLSVSLVPNAWASIARLGDELHVLETADGLFLDAVALLGDAAAKSEILDWAAGAGLAEMRTLWRAWSYDDETEEWRFMLLATREDALGECGLAEDDYVDGAAAPGPEGHAGIEPVDVPVGTAALRGLTGFAAPPDEDASDAIMVAFAMLRGEELAGRPFDGVWWCEIYAPEMLSSPRGGIFPERVKSWRTSRGSLQDVDDDAELNAMPDGETIASAPAPTM